MKKPVIGDIIKATQRKVKSMKKKIAAFIAVCFAATGILASCSKDNDNKSSAEKKNMSSDNTVCPETSASEKENISRKDNHDNSSINDTSGAASDDIPDKPIGGDVTGNWEFTAEDTGEIITLMLEDDGSGSIYIDTTKYLFITKNGNLCIYGTDIGDNSVDFDGTTLTVTLNTDLLGSEIEELTRNSTLMILEKTEPGSSSELDGEYRFTGGALGTVFSDKLTGKLLGNEELPIYIRISGEDFGIKIDRLFTCKTDGNVLTVSGTEKFAEDTESNLKYSVSGDKLIVYFLTGKKLILTRSKLK